MNQDFVHHQILTYINQLPAYRQQVIKTVRQVIQENLLMDLPNHFGGASGG